jgi:hypothetical protein
MEYEMKQFKAKLAAIACGAVLASMASVPAQAVTWSGNDGWEVQYTGFVNLFYNQLDFKNSDGSKIEDSALLNEGLLPSFHTMKAKSPTVGGLTGTSQITFAIDTSTDKNVDLNKGADDNIDLREVFFNVEGGFGTISVGRTLALFQRQAILKDITLFGVGGVVSPDENGTTLGRIGAGYVYPDFRARFLWQSPDMSGFQMSLGVFQPRETVAKVMPTHVDHEFWLSPDGNTPTAARPGSAANERKVTVKGVPIGTAGNPTSVTVEYWPATGNARTSQTVYTGVNVPGTASYTLTPGRPAGAQTGTVTTTVGSGTPTVTPSPAVPATSSFVVNSLPASDGTSDNVSSTTMQPTAIYGKGATGISALETDMPMFQGELTYNASMGDTSMSAWVGFQWQEADVIAGLTGTKADGTVVGVDPGGSQSVTTAGWNVGGELGFAGLSALVSYYQGSGLGTLFTQQDVGCAVQGQGTADAAVVCEEADANGGYAQLKYTIPGGGDSKTTLGGSWGYSETEANPVLALVNPDFAADRKNKGYTIGIYHDVNSWLKVIAEYNDYEYEHTLTQQVDGFSVGAFMFW